MSCWNIGKMKPKPENASLKTAGTKLGMCGRRVALLIFSIEGLTKHLHFHGIQLIPMFHSDIASLDKFGYCKIEGRIKDMIIRGGENVYPAEIEQFLHTHPKVQEAQVDQAYPGSLDFLSFISMYNLIRMSEKLWT